MILRRSLIAILAATTLYASASNAAEPDASNWSSVLQEAKGQTVYWNAWGGAENINDYIDWVEQELDTRYGVILNHVKISDTAEAVSRVLAEKAAGRMEGGAIDLIWINGENFASMKREGLLLPNAWANQIPNYALADTENKAVLTYDFTEEVAGLESPWGTAQLTFYYDSAEISSPPTNLADLEEWIANNPGRFTYAAPPNFIGATFIKQLAFGLLDDPSVMNDPVDVQTFSATTAPLWAWLDRVHPNLWRSGRVFAADTTQLKTLLADSEISIAMTFNPGEASSAINENLLPDTVRSFVLDYGSLGNAHFVAIPFNANAKAGAMVVANFLLSPQAQARKANEDIWGDPTVLSYEKLDKDGQGYFDSLTKGAATLSAAELGASISEPTAQWTEMLEAEWTRRYGAGK